MMVFLRKLKLFYFLVILSSCDDSNSVQFLPTPAPTPAPEFSLISACFNGECFDLIQIAGANAVSTEGGYATDNLRTAYVYKPDEDSTESGIPTYKGSSWPYITSSTDLEDFIIDEDISASISKNVNNVILVNSWPVYQYINDVSPNDANGNGIDSMWYAIKYNGESIEPKNMPPEALDVKILSTNGTYDYGDTLIASYNFYDSDGDIEGNSAIAWYADASKVSSENTFKVGGDHRGKNKIFYNS